MFPDDICMQTLDANGGSITKIALKSMWDTLGFLSLSFSELFCTSVFKNGVM